MKKEVMMIVKRYQDVSEQKVETEGAEKAWIRWLVSDKEGAPCFAMRQFRLEQGGHTPFHSHEWEHEMYVLQGEGKAVSSEGEQPLSPGVFMFIPPGEKHQFKNTGKGELQFLCMIPLPGRCSAENSTSQKKKKNSC
jgi:quercetin dioxygenase-like cupin family protein